MSFAQFEEDFALNPALRQELLQQATPGTEEYNLYRLQFLSQQLQDGSTAVTAEAIEEAMALLQAVENSNQVSNQVLLGELRTQIALLAYPVKPEVLLKHLSEDVGTLAEAGSRSLEEEEEDTDAADGVDVSEPLPSTLDPTLVKSAALMQKLLQEIETDYYSVQFPTDAWSALLSHPEIESLVSRMEIEQLSSFFLQADIMFSPKSLEIVGSADTGRLDEVIVQIMSRLYEEKRLDFSNYMKQFDHLTKAQLEMLVKLQPSVMSREGFVGLLEKRIVPAPFPESEKNARQDWLERMLAFVDNLSPKFNMHKLSVYLTSLEEDLRQSIWDKDKFLRCVAIPRNYPQYNQGKLKSIKPDAALELSSHSSPLEYWSQRVQSATRTRDFEVLNEYLSHFLLESKSVAEFEPFFDVKSFLDPLLAREMLTSGDKQVEKWSKLLPSDEPLARLSEKTILKFAPDNPATFQPADPVIFKLRAKNAKNILIRVFEIKTFECLQQSSDGVLGKNLNLDGLTPNWEHQLTLNHPSIEIHEVFIDLPELVNRRGAFVMDVISNGENSCAYFTKGALDYVERQSVAGHVITIIDEKQAKLSDSTIWLDGYYYKPNGDGDIIIPYRKPNAPSVDHIFLIHNGFTTRRDFVHREENYSLKLSCHLDTEALVAGSTAKVILKPLVQIEGNTVICPVGLLEQVVLVISSTDTNGIASTSTVPDFKINDVEWSEYNFQVPENLKTVRFTMSAKIKVIATGEHQDLSAEKEFSFDRPGSDQVISFERNGIWQTVRLQGEILTLLRKSTEGYHVLVLGKNGENRPNTPLEFQFEHRFWKKELKAYLESDENGLIHFGPLVDVTLLRCISTRQSWNLADDKKHLYPSIIHTAAGETVSVPFAQQDSSDIRNLALFSVSGADNDAVFLEDHTSHMRLHSGLLSIKDLAAGSYVLSLGPNTKIVILAARKDSLTSRVPGLEDRLVSTNPMMELLDSTKQPLYMSLARANEQSQVVEIQLCNWTPETRLSVVASKFLPTTAMYSNLAVLESESPWSMPKTELTPTYFRTGRVLDEEYQYILNRKGQATYWAGNLLTKPSVLLTPWSIAETTMSAQIMEKENLENVERMSMRACPISANRMSARKVNSSYMVNRYYDNSAPLLDFLVQPSVVKINLTPDAETGLVRMPFAAFKEASFIQIFAMDGHQALQQSVTLPRTARDLDFQKKDLRFKSQLDHQKHYIGERTGIYLDPVLKSSSSGSSSLSPTTASSTEAASVTLISSGSSSSAVRVINSVNQVYDLMQTLIEDDSQKQTLSKFGFVTDWHRFSTDIKKEKFSKWNCHELNLFLYRKDKAFFDAVVEPFLKNKLIKSFMDDFLIGVSLDRYVSLKEFGLLTTLEKCLLATRVPSIRPAVARWIKDRVHESRGANITKLFRTVMNSGNLEEREANTYSPTSPAYSPTSPSYTPGGIGYSGSRLENTLLSEPMEVVETVVEEQEHMGFDLMEDELVMAPMSYAAPAPPRESRMRMKRMARFMSGDARVDSEKLVKKRFKPVDLTKEMAETYYYDRQDYAAADKNVANLFYLDYVQWAESMTGSFLSQNFVTNAASFTDAMATLALLDVGFKAKDAALTRSTDQNLIITSQSPAIVFHSSTKELSEAPATGSVLVTQQYFSQEEKTVYDETLMTMVRRYIKPTEEFKPLESYGAHVVLMNATPNPIKVHLDVQIPQGALSIYGSIQSGQDIQLKPHGTFQYEYGFYFPEAGEFAHYPAHVSNYENIIAFASPSVLTVQAPEPDRKETDTGTWNYVMKRGTKDEILAKLASSSLTSVPADALIPRLQKDKKFLIQVTSVLRSRQEYNDAIWRVGLLLHNQELAKEYLAQHSIAKEAGQWFTSPVLVVRPQSRLEAQWDKSFKYLEYFPLINARVHKATRNAVILNDRFKDQYQRFLQLLSQKSEHDSKDLLVLIVYLLAQDRIVEAKGKFKELSSLVGSPSAAQTFENDPFQQLQYDYVWAYLSLCVEVRMDSTENDLTLVDLNDVQKILEKYRDYPVQRWNRMFEDMQQYVDEIRQDSESATAAGSPSLGGESSQMVMDIDVDHSRESEEEDEQSDAPIMVEFKIGSDSVVAVKHRGVREVTVEYYSIDAETMFSASPLTFSDQGESESSGGDIAGEGPNSSSNSYRLVKPNGVDAHTVKRAVKNDGLLMIPILKQFLNTNVMISVSTSPPSATRSWKAYYSQTIEIQTMEQTGTVRVLSKKDGRPIRGGYVKVYAEMKQGNKNTAFWKDGYTDLVGRFGYAQVSTGASSSNGSGGGLSDVKRFVLFVDGDREGCVVKTVPVPPV